MTQEDDDPFAKTQLGTPASAAFVRPGKTIVAEPADEALEAPRAEDRTAFDAPIHEGLADQTSYGMPVPAALVETALVDPLRAPARLHGGPPGAPFSPPPGPGAGAEQTAFGAPLAAALAEALAAPAGAQVRPARASNTVLEAPSPEAIAAWQPSEQARIQPADAKGFTELGGAAMGGAGLAGRDPASGWTELGANRPGMTLPGGLPPADAFAPKTPDPLGSTQPSPVGFAAAEAASALAADRELARAGALHDEGVYAGKAGHFAHADALLRESLDIRRRYRPAGDVVIANGCTSLGTLYYFGRRPDLAEPLYREAWMLHRQGLGDVHPETATRAVELARALLMLGRVPEAYGFLRGAHEVYGRTLGPMHPATLEAVQLMRHLYG